MRKVDVSSVLGASAENPEGLESCIDVSGLNLYYAKDKRALNGIDLKDSEAASDCVYWPQRLR